MSGCAASFLIFRWTDSLDVPSNGIVQSNSTLKELSFWFSPPSIYVHICFVLVPYLYLCCIPLHSCSMLETGSFPNRHPVFKSFFYWSRSVFDFANANGLKWYNNYGCRLVIATLRLMFLVCFWCRYRSSQ